MTRGAPPISTAPSLDDVKAAVSRMILSASGWRTVFAADGDEQSDTPETGGGHLVLVAIAARLLGRTVAAGARASQPVMALATDTRPTGPVLAQAAVRGLLAEHVSIRYIGVAASPEILAYVRSTPSADGFLYLTASHNPIGHNGLKFGGTDGGVLGGEANAALAAEFRSAAADAGFVEETIDLLRAPAGPREQEVEQAVTATKRAALAAYADFSREVFLGPGVDAPAVYKGFTDALRSASPGIVIDMNGSARAVSIDRSVFADTCRLHVINDTPGRIAHQIVPEGEGLQQCAAELEGLSGDGFILGYVPDNDGDRGNLVYVDEVKGGVLGLEAQAGFALSVAAELSWLAATGVPLTPDGRFADPVAVVVNGPTSMRVDRVAGLFGAAVHRAEVGEANVVTLARSLRGEGYLVRVLGEGSNGGTITHPSAVRDPLATVVAVLKLLYTPSGGRASPLDLWADRAGLTVRPCGLGSLIRSLPTFTTTSAYEPRAIMRIASTSHADLKRRFEATFPDEWHRKRTSLRDRLGVESWRIENYEGTITRMGPGNRTGAERGGLKVVFSDHDGTDRAFIWMRGSGTEPVFRIMADVEGDHPEVEAELLEWQRSMVERADRE